MPASHLRRPTQYRARRRGAAVPAAGPQPDGALLPAERGRPKAVAGGRSLRRPAGVGSGSARRRFQERGGSRSRAGRRLQLVRGGSPVAVVPGRLLCPRDRERRGADRTTVEANFPLRARPETSRGTRAGPAARQRSSGCLACRASSGLGHAHKPELLSLRCRCHAAADVEVSWASSWPRSRRACRSGSAPPSWSACRRCR
jgi:hypothetical protein